jgi:ABC-2 type transport system permease protein
MNWRVVFSIARKDLVDAVKNLYIMFAIVMPIGLSFLFQLVLPSQKDIERVELLVYDQGESQLATNLRAMTNLEVIAASSEQTLTEKLDSDKSISGGLVIPAGFDAAVAAGAKPELIAYVNSKANQITQATFRSLVIEQVWSLVRQEFPAQISWHRPQPESASGEQASQEGSNIGVNVDLYLLNVLLAMAIAMVGVFAVPTLLVEEKEKHTLEALLVAPGGPAEVVAGKGIVGLVYCVVISGILLGLNDGFAGNWPVTLIATLLGSLFLIGVGLLMGGVFRNIQQVNTWSSIVMLVAIMPSWVGIFGLPEPYSLILNAIPTNYFTRPLNLALTGKATSGAVWVDLAILTGCVIAAFAAVVWTLKRERK